MKTTGFSLALFLSLIPVAAFAQLQFSLPIDCAIGTDCFVQNYVDHDPQKGGESYQDFTCGHLSYDGHTGTDFRLRNLAQMEAGVKVLAAADGRVIGLREGVEDIGVLHQGSEQSNKGKECGNRVVLSHSNGWVTQYCHLKKGSIRVRNGQDVKRGDMLAEVGLSGETAFPHVHFDVRHQKETIDPFVGYSDAYPCGTSNHNALWDKATQELLSYRPSGILGFGFADHKPSETEIRSGKLQDSDLTAEDSVMVTWLDIFGLGKGEKLTLILRGPDGAQIATTSAVLEHSKALAYLVAGRINRNPPWQSGNYTAEVIVATPQDDGSFTTRIQETRNIVLGASGNYINAE